MAQQVKTPRFYVDIPTFLHATGQLKWDSDKGGAKLLYMNCANPQTIVPESNAAITAFKIGDSINDNPTKFPINFFGYLNHNFASSDSPARKPKLDAKIGLSFGTHEDSIRLDNYDNILNSDMEYNGTSLFKLVNENNEPITINEYWRSFELYWSNVQFTENTKALGSLVVGKYFDCPNSPDLNLTMSRRFDGIKKQKTIGGKTLSNIYYDGPTEWTMYGKKAGIVSDSFPPELSDSIETIYKYPPFELDYFRGALDENENKLDKSKWRLKPKSGLGRKGLKSWKLSFSYISQSNMFIDYESSSTAPYTTGHFSSVTDSLYPDTNQIGNLDENANPILSDDSFNFVWNTTLGGTLPFIFQPDNTNANPDQFSICMFRENTLSIQQVAFNTYNVSMTIDEIA